MLYVMNTKLTLRMEETRIRRAKTEARRRGKSVSQMVAEYFDSLGAQPAGPASLPPVTAALLGILKGHSADEEDYRRHLREKHL
jgi:hypothetical protein